MVILAQLLFQDAVHSNNLIVILSYFQFSVLPAPHTPVHITSHSRVNGGKLTYNATTAFKSTRNTHQLSQMGPRDAQCLYTEVDVPRHELVGRTSTVAAQQ